MGIHRVLVAVMRIAPHFIEKVHATEHATRISSEEQQQVELPQRQRDFLAARQMAATLAGVVRRGALTIDPVAREVHLSGEEVALTSREFDLLLFFARNPGRVFNRMDLLNQVWGYSHDGYEHTVNSHINRLRSKIESDPTGPRHIVTVWGMGYKFVDPGEDA